MLSIKGLIECEGEGEKKTNEKRSKYSRGPVVYGRQKAAEEEGRAGEEGVKEGVRCKLTKEQRKMHIPVVGGHG